MQGNSARQRPPRGEGFQWKGFGNQGAPSSRYRIDNFAATTISVFPASICGPGWDELNFWSRLSVPSPILYCDVSGDVNPPPRHAKTPRQSPMRSLILSLCPEPSFHNKLLIHNYPASAGNAKYNFISYSLILMSYSSLYQQARSVFTKLVVSGRMSPCV
jgi:hypothetical protein